MKVEGSPLGNISAALRRRVYEKIAKTKTADKHYDVIVIGLGSMGSACCHYLAKKGVSVLGIEQFGITHEKGSHTGQSRIIRKAYFEHEDYVPLLEKAYFNWDVLEQETGIQIYYPTGLLYFGEPDKLLINRVKKSSGKYGIPLESLSRNEYQKRYPQFRIPKSYECLFEKDAGFLSPDRAILAFTEQAINAGACIQLNERTLEWKEKGTEIVVTTDKQEYFCSKLIVTVGAWAGKTLPSLSSKIKVTRQMIGWAYPQNSASFELGKLPCWIIDHEENKGIYYGFPILPEEQFGTPVGLKLGYHYPAEPADPDQLNPNPKEGDTRILIHILNNYFHGAGESIHALKACMYGNTPDDHFIIDFEKENKNIVIAAGFSGHGFKFASAFGEILTDLATEGKTSYPIDFLTSERLQK